VKCSFCSHEFDEAEAAAACRACVLSANCGRVRCPRCGYEDVRPSRLARAFSGWRRGRRAREGRRGSRRCPDGLTLQELGPGGRGTVLRLLDLEQRGRLAQRLMVLGVLPGVQVEVVRCSPAVVFRIGHSQFAVDDQLARMVLVKPEREDQDGSGTGNA